MIISKTFNIENFKFTKMTLATDDSLKIIVDNPDPSAHLNQENMILKGSFEIKIDEYSKIVTKGESSKFRPREGQEQFQPNLLVSMTALEATDYLCVINESGGILKFTSIDFSSSFNFTTGSVVAPTEDYILNGVSKTAGTPILFNQEDVIEMAIGSKVGIFTPS